MKNIIIMSALNLWSINKQKGAPSFYNTVKGYCDAGWKVYLINTDSFQLGQYSDLNDITHFKVNLFFKNAHKIKKLGYFLKLFNQIFLDWQFKKIAFQLLTNEAIKNKVVIYAYEVASVNAAKKISCIFNIPLVTRFQGTIMANKNYSLINIFRYYPHFQALTTAADVLIMTNDGTNGDKVLKLLDNRSDKIYFWRNGVDLPEIDRTKKIFKKCKSMEDQKQKREKVFITVSRLVKWKRVDRAILAFSEVLEDHPKCRLLIVGDGDERFELQKLAEELGIKEKINFVGGIPHANVFDYINSADVFLSLYDLSNVGNPLMEAMSCGKPIITLNVGDTASVIQHEKTGILLNLSDIDKISHYMCKLITDESYAAKLGQNAFHYAKENFYSWSQRIVMELNVVEKLINDRANSLKYKKQ